MIFRRFKNFMYVAAIGVFLIVSAGIALSCLRYIPPEPMDISRRFIDLVQAGDLPAAYLLTEQKGAVGATLKDFEANIRRQLGVTTFPMHRPIEMLGIRSGPQTYSNRLRRWLMGRRLDSDLISIDYYVSLPFEVRVAFHDDKWRIVYFQSHAI
ncbi:MAG: hypothetical protein PW788_14570 [Micavibrio sp.]|nr:hypothetical protein [Micavibrio sp.]